jgi:hypothetical protein
LLFDSDSSSVLFNKGITVFSDIVLYSLLYSIRYFATGVMTTFTL